MRTTLLADPVTLGVLRALAEGKTDHEAAQLVHVSPRTVQRVIDNFKQASGAPTRFAAGAAACRLGLLGDQHQPTDGRGQPSASSSRSA